jgi:hypothetical protein
MPKAQSIQVQDEITVLTSRLEEKLNLQVLREAKQQESLLNTLVGQLPA